MADIYGANPINIQWSVVRGDTAKLRIHFMESDEVTPQDTSGWVSSASAYNPKTGIVDVLDASVGEGYVDVIADSEITAGWGTGYAPIVAELSFDLQIIREGETWTPIIGTIAVIPDITPSNI